MVAKLDEIRTNILGATIIGLLNGELTDETIAAVDSINRDDVPEPLNNMVGWIHGMSTYEPLRETQITSLLTELRGATTEVLEQRIPHPNPLSGDWIVMYSLLEAILEGSDYDIRGNADMDAEAGTEIPRMDRIPAWAQPLIQHIRNSNTQGDELNLELLDVLEAQIQKRKAELTR
jgi:hypothetical protein